MNLFFKIVVFLFLPLMGFSQGKISGRITDSKTKLPLGNANIWLVELKKGTASNADGYFNISDIPQGKYSLIISFIGYKDSSLVLNVIERQETEINLNIEAYLTQMPTIVVTATRNVRDIADIPNRIELISNKQIDILPGNNVDDYLRNLTGVNVDRFSGIYSKNASITLRGLSSAQRTLVLLDGIPMNKTDGGSINWNRIDPESVDKIEVIKGPSSALYGSNGMSGVINIITKNPYEQTGGSASLSCGTYNTTGGRFNYNISKIKESKGFFGGINTFYRQGDGYILYPDSTRDSTDVKTYLREGVVQGKVGYSFNSNSKLVVSYGYFDDKRGDGISVYDTEGGFYKYTTHFGSINYSTVLGKYKISANAYLQREKFHEQKESLKKDKLPPFEITQYVLYNTLSNRDDNGINIIVSRSVSRHHYMTGGIDIKKGKVDASDIYCTSTDVVTNMGNMNNYALFLQDEANFIHDQLKVIAGIRSDYVQFFKGRFLIDEPTATTSVLTSTTGNIPESDRLALSPKISAQYNLSKDLRAFISFGTGFRPPMLDDLCRNGNISKGLKLANPYLKPEKIYNYELGINWKPHNNVEIEPTVFYSIGTDFQYFVGTGDSIFAGTKMNPVLKRENIGKAEIYGAELSLRWNLTENISFQANYAYYHSTIKEFNVTGYTVKDLTGKSLMEVAPNQANASVWWKNKFVNVALVYHCKDNQWIDDENTIKSGAYSLFDIKLSRTYKDMYKFTLSCDNLLDKIYIDDKGLLSIGRYIIAEVTVKFK